MLSTHWEEVKSIFEAALLRNEQEREAFVLERCGDDRELADEVLRLLAADRESSKFLEEAALPSTARFSLLAQSEILAKDDILCGRFKVLAYLGEGGMGQVYKAVDLELRQQIAVKVIRPEIADAPGVLARFKREVAATRKVTHPNVCRTFDLETHTPTDEHADRLGSSITFLTMELLIGETLADRIRQSGPLPPEQVRVFARQIALALNAAHAAGVIHCDLKPSNIFLSGDESHPRVVVTDFGIAKFIRSEEQTSPSTLSGAAGNGAAGTPIYMAPEQIETGECSQASDFYSFGLVLYEALTAQKLSPYRRSHSEIGAALSAAGLESRAIEPAWIDIIARCTQPNPSARFQGAQEVLDALPTSKNLKAAEVRRAAAHESGHGHSVASRWNAIPWPVRILALLVAAVIPLVLVWRARPNFEGSLSDAAAGSTVAVLPLVDQGNDAQINALAKKVMLSLTNDLGEVSGLKVSSQAAVRDLRDAPDVKSIGRTLSVDNVVNGTVLSAGGNSILQVELVDARTGFQVWGQSYMRTQLEDPSLADDIAQEISYQLRTRSDKGSVQKRASQHSGVPAAETAFLQGKKAQLEGTYDGFERSVKLFQQAIDADPNYAAATAELSRSYALMAINNGRPEPSYALLNQSESTARRALRIDSTLAAAYTSLAQVEILRDLNWAGAEEDFKRAEELEPGYVPAHVSYALHLLTAQGRFAEARAQLTYADMESPKTLGTSLAGAVVAYFSRDYDNSIQQIEAIRKQFHTSAVAIEIEALDYLALNSPKKALKVLAEAPPDPSAPHELRDALRGIALAQMGDRRNALAELKQLEGSNRDVDSSYYIAALCARLGDRDAAMAYLDKSHQDRQTDVLFLGVDPLMDSLRSDQRFRSLLSTLNLL